MGLGSKEIARNGTGTVYWGESQNKKEGGGGGGA